MAKSIHSVVVTFTKANGATPTVKKLSIMAEDRADAQRTALQDKEVQKAFKIISCR